VENECTLHNFVILAIFVPEIIKVGENLTKLWQKNFVCFFFIKTRCNVLAMYRAVGTHGHCG